MIPHGPMEQNLGIDTKIKSVTLSDPKLQFSGCFGHSGQSEVSESDPN